MDKLDYKEALEMLRKAGLTASEISRLERFRRKYAASEIDQAPIDQHRLEFVRWLVATHRLTEQ